MRDGDTAKYGKMIHTSCTGCGKDTVSYKQAPVCIPCRRKRRIRICARPGCEAEFLPPTGQYAKIYCTMECAHVVLFRYYRKPCPICMREWAAHGNGAYRKVTCGRSQCYGLMRSLRRWGWTPAIRAKIIEIQAEARADVERERVQQQLDFIRMRELRNNGIG